MEKTEATTDQSGEHPRTGWSSCFNWDAEREEHFTFGSKTWDVSLAKRLVVLKPRKVETVAVSDLRKLAALVHVNLERAYGEGMDTTFPLLMAHWRNSPKSAFMLIDGWHRLARALRDGPAELPVVTLTARESWIVSGKGKG